MANHKQAVSELANHIEREYLRLGYSVGRQTNTSLEILCPPEMENADFLFEDIKSFDSPSCSVESTGNQISLVVQFDRQGTHVIHTGMGVMDAFGVLLKSIRGCVPSTSSILKLSTLLILIAAIQYRELLARELEWRTATLDDQE